MHAHISPELFIACGAILLVTLPFILRDVKNRQKALSEWQKITGKVRAILYVYRGSSVIYSYTFNGQEYKSRDIPNKYQPLRNLKEGSEITLLVNPNDPTKSYIWAPRYKFFDERINRDGVIIIIIVALTAVLWLLLGPPNV
jgi:hypothetical protein